MEAAKRGVIIGMALGDGHVRVRRRIRGNSVMEERCLRVLHGPQQRAYCEWKAKRIGWALGGRNVNVTKVRNGPGGKYTAYQFTVGHKYFGQVRRWLYPNGKKLFTRRVLDMLTPEAVAIWYMDDGSARRNIDSQGYTTSVATDIATMCSEAEAVTISDWFVYRFDVRFKVRCNKHCTEGQQFYIQANTADTRKFVEIIAPHVPECMMYKLAHVASFNSHERQTPVSVCECGTTLYANRRKGKCSACYHRKRRQGKAAGGDDIVRPNGKTEPLEAKDKEP